MSVTIVAKVPFTVKMSVYLCKIWTSEVSNDSTLIPNYVHIACHVVQNFCRSTFSYNENGSSTITQRLLTPPLQINECRQVIQLCDNVPRQ